MKYNIKEGIDKIVKISDAEWQAFSECLHKEVLPKKTHILKEDERCNFIAFIEQGAFRYYHIKDGIEKVTGLFFDGDTMTDYTSFLTNQTSNHYIQAISDATIFKLYKTDLDKLYDKYKNIERLGRIMAENLSISLDRRLNSFLYLSPKERYEELITRNPQLIQQVPQYMIASYLGIEPESLSRIRKRKK